MKKILTFGGIILLLIAVMISLRVILGNPEDGWLCTEAGWVKHGSPSAPMPETPCGKVMSPADDQSSENPVVGGDKDDHGCIGSAGYQWCPSTEKCQRMWEEKCEE